MKKMTTCLHLTNHHQAMAILPLKLDTAPHYRATLPPLPALMGLQDLADRQGNIHLLQDNNTKDIFHTRLALMREAQKIRASWRRCPER